MGCRAGVRWRPGSLHLQALRPFPLPSPIPSVDHCVYEPNEFSEIINHQPVPTVGVGWVSQPFATGPFLPVTAKVVKVRMVH